jgi:hypothetical protein
MPFKSEKQRRYLWKNEPALAEKWAHEKSPMKKISKKTKRKAVLSQMKGY